MKHFFCTICDNPLNIKEGDFIFSYDIECCNNHFSKNVDLEDILSTKKEKNYICEIHKKNKIIHCKNCNLDICLFCFKESHKLHEMEYLKSLNYDRISKILFENELKEDKKYIESFIGELMNFKNEISLYIDILKSDLQKFYKFRYDLIDNIFSDITSFTNIENVKNVFENKNLEIKNIMGNFLSCNTFINRYNSLKNLFELMFKKGKYIENEIIKDIYKESIIPIDEKYFMKIDDKKFIILEKALELNLRRYKFITIFEKSVDFYIKDIKLKENKNIKKRLSFYLLSYIGNYIKTFIYEATIDNLCDFNLKIFAQYDKYIKLFVLSEDKIIIDDTKKISLYDDSFKSPKLVSNEIFNIYKYLKIDENTFIFSFDSSIGLFLVKIINNRIYKSKINNCGYELIYFSEKKKLLFTTDQKFIYLINFNSPIPEVIQKIEIKFFSKEDDSYNYARNENLIRYLTSFNDESIYLIYNKFLVQYKIIGSELMEISRINYI